MMRKLTNLISIFFIIPALWASSKSVDIANKKPAETKKVVIKTLNKLDIKYKELEETNGFSYRLQDGFFTPFNFDIFIGSYGNKNNSVITIDTRKRLSYALVDAIEQDNGATKGFDKVYGTKSILLANVLNLITPAAGILYTNLGSPLSRRSSAYFDAAIYFGVDLLLFWLGSKTFFKHNIDPLGHGKVATALLMGGHRLFHMYGLTVQIMQQNRLVNVGYKFRF